MLISARIKKISIPVYYCHEVTEFIKDTGVDIKFYNIDESFLPLNPDFSDGRVLLYPNYFGVNDASVVNLLSTFNPNRIIIDGAQALVSNYECLANINSYRKFLPVVDGSLLRTQFRVEANMAYRTRHMELLQAYQHDHGALPVANTDIDPRMLGRLRPAG